MRKIIYLLFIIAVISCNSNPTIQSEAPNEALASLLANYYNERMKLFPLEATANGDIRYNNLLPADFTDSYRAKLKDFFSRYNDSINTFNPTTLENNDKKSYNIFKYQMDMALKGLQVNFLGSPDKNDITYMPFDQFNGVPIAMGQMGSGTGNQPFKTVKDYDDWLQRATAFSAWADSAIVYFKKGKIEWQGTYDELLEQEFYNLSDLNLKVKAPETIKNEDDEPKAEEEEEEEDEGQYNGKSRRVMPRSPFRRRSKERKITILEVKEAKMKWDVYIKYFKYTGGLILFGLILFDMVIWQGLSKASDIILSAWGNEGNDDSINYFQIYTIISLSSCIFIMIRLILLFYGSYNLSVNLHNDMITKIVKAPINLFHDRTPKGQIFNRFSSDFEVIINNMIITGNTIVCLYQLIGTIFICCYFEIWSLAFTPILLFSWFFTSYYIKAGQDLKRLEGVSKSPILNVIGETLPGAMLIRAYKYEQNYFNKYFELVDNLFKVNLYTTGALNWFGINLDLLAFTYILFLIILAIALQDKFTPAGIGFILTYSLTLQIFLFEFLNNLGIFTNNMVSMERCLNYTEIEGEGTPNEVETPENWPSTGSIEFLDYCVKYRPDKEMVLKNLDISIESGEKIGIVGRTGSGKSTMALSLFRILEGCQGQIKIDGVDISTIDLQKLRKNLTIIPQDPSLLKGTLKYNIDPLDQFTEEEIITVIKSVGFWHIVEDSELGLEFKVIIISFNIYRSKKMEKIYL